MITAYHKLRNLELSDSEYESLFREYSDKTMGRLIEKVLSLYKLDDRLREELWQIHRKRNFFAHHYFKNQSFGWETPDDRVRMVKEFDHASELSQSLDQRLTEILLANLRSIGFSDSDLTEVERKMKSGELGDPMIFEE